MAQEKAQKLAEEAKAAREQARLQAEVVVPANAERERVVIAAEAEKQQSIRIAEGQAQGLLTKMKAEAEGVQSILAGKAEGYRRLVEACTTAHQAAALLLIEKLTDVATIQAQAIQELPIEKIIVWDGGGDGGGGLSGLGGRLMGVLPPMHDLARQIGLDLPEFLGRVSREAAKQDPAASADKKKEKEKDEGPETLHPVAKK